MASSNFVRFRGPPVITTGMAPNTCLLATAAQTVATICAPSKFFVRTITASFDLAPFAGPTGAIPAYGSTAQNALDPHPCFSGARTGVTIEGPFLRYTVAQGALGANKLKGTHDNAAIVFFADLVGDRMLFLPFPGTVEVIGQYPCTVDFETFILEAGSDARVPDPFVRGHGTPLDSNATLSLRLATGGAVASTRSFKALPPGAHSMTVNTENLGSGGVYPSVSVYQETVPSYHVLVGPGALPLATLVPLSLNGGITTAFGTRLPVHNAWGCDVSSGTLNTEGLVQFHAAYT